MLTRDHHVKMLLFVFTRFPFINGLTLLMLLSERANRETYPPFPPNIIYVHIFLFVLMGVAMSTNIRRKEAALVYAGQLGYLIYLIQASTSLRYRDWLKARMIIRQLGCVGTYLHFAHLSGPGSGSRQLQKIGNTFLGIYAVGHAFSVINIIEEKEALEFNVENFLGWSSEGVLNYILGALFTISALCLFSEKYTEAAYKLLISLICTLVLLQELNLKYWTRRAGVDFWNHIRTVSDSLNIVLGIAILLSRRRFI